MSEFISTCDSCLFNFACENVGDEDCLTPCVSEDSPLYKVFAMGYNKGFDNGYAECESEYTEEFDELDEALQYFDDEEEEGEDA